MLQIFRNFFGSKIGVGVTLGFVGLISLAFLGGDVASGLGFGTGSGSSHLASVGGSRVDQGDLQIAAKRQVERLREQMPTMDMRTFVAEGGVEQILNSLIDLSAVREFGKAHDIVIGDRLIDSEIAKIPRVQGPDGKFSEASYQMFLRQEGLNDKQLRDRVSGMLMERQLLSATQFGVGVPTGVAQRYAGVVTERRTGTIITLPAAAFAPATAPSPAEIQGWYASHKADYTLPERRVVRFATFDSSIVKAVPAPTEAEIAARYNANKAQYVASESRKVSQLVLSSEAAAKALSVEVAGGKTLEAAAAGKGLSLGSLGTVSQGALSNLTSTAAAQAVFAAPKGKLVGPLKAPLGWLLLRVDAVEGKAGKTLDQARAELVSQISAEKQRAALTDFSARIEDEFNNGASLADVTKELNLTITATAPLVADGSVYGKADQKAPAVLTKLIQTAFLMEGEGQPQLAEVETGKSFVVFDVSAIEPSAPPPVASIQAQIAADIRLAKGAAAAKAAAERVQALIAKGAEPGAAMQQLGMAALPPVDRVNLARQQVQAMAQTTPPPVLLLFSLAKGKTRLMAAPRNHGWYVVTTQTVTPGQVSAADPRLAQFSQSIAQTFSTEYGDQMRAAMGAEVGVKRNETAIKAVRAQLGGGN
jgi:peptidyl-prolyl cis-trans isomerase D